MSASGAWRGGWIEAGAGLHLIDAAMAEPVETHFLWRPQLRDPSDELVLEAAVNGRASAIVTFNEQDFGVVPLKFGVEVLSPVDALRRIRK